MQVSPPPPVKPSLDFSHAYFTCTVHSHDTALTDRITSKTKQSSLIRDAGVNLGVTGAPFVPSTKPGWAHSCLCQLAPRDQGQTF